MLTEHEAFVPELEGETLAPSATQLCVQVQAHQRKVKISLEPDCDNWHSQHMIKCFK